MNFRITLHYSILCWVAKVKCILGFPAVPNPHKSHLMHSGWSKYAFRHLEHTWLVYLTLDLYFGGVRMPVPNVCMTLLMTNRKERMYKARDRKRQKKRANSLAFPLEYRTTGTWQMKMTGDQDQRS